MFFHILEIKKIIDRTNVDVDKVEQEACVEGNLHSGMTEHKLVE